MTFLLTDQYKGQIIHAVQYNTDRRTLIEITLPLRLLSSLIFSRMYLFTPHLSEKLGGELNTGQKDDDKKYHSRGNRVCSSLLLVLGDPGVDGLRVVLHHLSDESLLRQLLEGLPGQRAPHLEPLGHDGRRDQLVGGHLLQQLVVGGLVEEHQVVELVPGLSLGPLLLLGLAAASSLLLLGRLGRGLRRLSVLLSTLKSLTEKIGKNLANLTNFAQQKSKLVCYILSLSHTITKVSAKKLNYELNMQKLLQKNCCLTISDDCQTGKGRKKGEEGAAV